MPQPTPGARQVMLGELIGLVSGVAMGEQGDKAKDIHGRVYEYSFYIITLCAEWNGWLSNEALPVQEWRYFIRKRCPCVLPVQFRRSAGAFARARSGQG